MPLRTVVLDIETVPNDAALARLAAMRATAREMEPGWPKWLMNRVVAASVLTIEGNLEMPTFRLQSWHLGMMREEAIIAEVERAVEDAHQLITFNGRAFDLPVLRARAMAARSLAVPKIAALLMPKATRHRDLSDELCGWGSPRPSLTEVAALLSLPAKRELVGTSVPALAETGDFVRIAEHCDTDIMTTYLAFLHQAMSDIGSGPFVTTITGFQDWLRREVCGRRHLAPYLEAIEALIGLRPADEQPLPDLASVDF